MAVRRRRTSRPAKRPEAIRVLKVTSEAQWQKLVAKLGDRLLLIHFSATWATPSQHFRPYVNDIAKRPQFSHVVFVEVDVDQMSELATGMEVQACPTVVCWKNGGVVEMSERGKGADPTKLVKMLERHAGAKPSKPRWQGLLFKAVTTVAAVAAAGFAFQQLRGQTSEGRAAALDEQLKTVKQSLSLAKRRRQSKIVQQLQTQLQQLSQERAEVDRLLQAAKHNAAEADAPGSSSGGGGGDFSSGGDFGSGGDAAAASAAVSDYSSDEEDAPVAALAAAFDEEDDNFAEEDSD